MENTLILIWLFLVTVYGVIPGAFVRLFGYRALQRGVRKNTIALTFDDGPHEHYTQRLLDLLQRFGVKATFFVVGRNAEQHPDVIARIHREGHLIGIHNYKHTSNWLLSPKHVRRQVERTADIIEGITGYRPVHYRPPWGIVNLFDLVILKDFKLVLWSFLIGDWRRRSKRDMLLSRLKKGIKGGDIILLHDNGSTFGAYREAPEEMLGALEKFLLEMKEKGMRFITVSEMEAQPVPDKTRERKQSRAAAWLTKLWLGWETVFASLYRLQQVAPDIRFLRVHARRYTGAALTLEDGTVFEHGDRIMELHLDNRMLYEVGLRSRSEMHLAIQLVRLMQEAMPKIAEFVKNKPEYDDVKGLYGISLINRGVAQFGFTVFELPKGLFSQATRIYLRILLRAVHPQGRKRLGQRTEQLIPKIVALSREALLARYGAPHESESEAAAASPQGEPDNAPSPIVVSE